ncbi:hypothetical protein [Aquitalea pelogenes]|uniref:hypothetical protein n=1 Tax=Aquitalea pelogenes TaxID=1293573 RepID=UPI0035AF4201
MIEIIKLTGSKWLFAMLLVTTVLMLGLAIAGGVYNYTAIPYWDMWDGTLGFLLKLQRGEYAVWWGQHNEHRIVLSRIIFWFDSVFFGDANIFSELVNYIFVFCSAVFFVFYLRVLSRDRQLPKIWLHIFSLLLFSWIFLWSQADNFYQAFQSQFVLAQLLPLVSFYYFAKSVDESRARYFWYAMVCACLALGSMANGVLALPLLFALSLFFRQPVKNCLIVLLLAVLGVVAYFYDYHSPSSSGASLSLLLTHKEKLLLYVLTYLGSPFYYLFLGVMPIAIFSGAVFILLFILVVLRVLKEKQRHPYVLALVFFLIYILLTALVTGAGRLTLGVEQALESRYTTPVLMAWAALALTLGRVVTWPDWFFPTSLSIGIVLLMLLMLLFQFNALLSANRTTFIRSHAALALAMGVKDNDLALSLFPDPAYPRLLLPAVERGGISIFSREPLVSMRANIGRPAINTATSACIGFVDHVYEMRDEPDYLRFDGWIFSPAVQRVPERISVLNQQGIIVGYAEVGLARDDVKAKYGAAALFSGFGGYVRKSLMTRSLTAIGSNPECKLVL